MKRVQPTRPTRPTDRFEVRVAMNEDTVSDAGDVAQILRDAADDVAAGNLHGGAVLDRHGRPAGEWGLVRDGSEVVAFTGVERAAPLLLARAAADAVALYGPAAEWVTGAQHGADTACALAAYDAHPGARHVLVVPERCRVNDDVVRFAEGHGFEVVAAKWQGDAAATYMLRNQMMVERADRLVALPATPRELFRGSGTWATIRRGRWRGIMVNLRPLSEYD